MEVRIKVEPPLDADEDGLIEVSTLEQLNAIRYDLDGDGTPTVAGMAEYTTAFGTVTCMGGCTGYELMSNLDFATSRWGEGASGGDAVDEGWESIGDNSTNSSDSRFTAIFEGNGHTISNLFIDRSSTGYVGLFGYVRGSTAGLRNIGLLEVKVTGDDYVGGLVGCIFDGTVSGSYATGSVTGDDYLGGLVGSIFDGTVSGSYATGSVTGENLVGGLVGYSSSGMVSGSYATGSVTGKRRVGGLVATNWDSTVSNSYATGVVTGIINVGGLVGSNWDSTVSGSYAAGAVTGDRGIGGLMGFNSGDISGNYATGSVTGDRGIGGLVGDNDGTILSSYATGSVVGRVVVGGLVGDNESDISGSYATGSVTGDDYVGGLVGVNYHTGTVSGSYATGAVTGDDYVGGLVGYNVSGTVTASYYNRQTTGQNDTGKGESKTTAELLTPTGYTGIYATWGDDTDYWDFGTNGQYPVLKIDVDGNGTVGDAADLRAQRPLRFRQTSYAFAYS